MIVDCHLDLAMNAVHWNRDLTKSLMEIRERESGMTDKPDRGRGVVCFEQMLSADIRLCVATQIGHSVSQRSPLQGWNSPEIAWAQTQAQLAWYREMERLGFLVPVRTVEELDRFLKVAPSGRGIGYLLSLEGADSLIDLDYLHRAYQYGLRLLGPAHYGPGRYAAGTGESDGLTPLGFRLLDEMSKLGIILDVTHLTDLGFDQALEHFSGPVVASHHNCRALVNHQRQLTDEQIKRLVDRQAIIGMAFDAWMLVPDWIRGESTPAGRNVTLEKVADQVDHVCQLVGHCESIAIGTDLDGGYGTEQTPVEMDSIARITVLRGMLERRNYSGRDVDAIFAENALKFFRRSLPQEAGSGKSKER